MTLTCGFSEVLKKLLVKDEGHSADLLHFGLGRRVPVDEVCSDGDGELPPELLTTKTWRQEENQRNSKMTQDAFRQANLI